MDNISENLKLKIKHTEVINEGKFLKYCRTFFVDKHNNPKNWEFVARQNSNKAAIINAQTDLKVILVKQFRIPLGKFSLEFPAGLIDDGETAAECALRELEEETGYQGRVMEVSPSICTSAGLTAEEIYFVKMHIDGERNQQILDDTEEIEVVEFFKKGIKEAIKLYLAKNPDTVLDSKVWSTFYENCF